MANNQIKVNLMFQADTQKARNSLKQLQTDLNAITTASANGEFKLTDKVIEGQRAAVQLKNILNECVNMDTGKFDLSKFSHSLKKGGTDLKQMATQLQQLGPEGSRAFMSLAQSIVQAEIPTKRVNAQLAQMAKTIKDTARWQISSSIIHGFQGALENAYGYAQDLNRSLNDIRIVTGYSEKYMANFAIEANRTAKALSATTKEYAEASLIYFQQGLSDEQVAQRTATTIKLANVTGRSAEDVSSYMTAVWNNFDDGTKSLEYYADAIAALGAATASSSEEIATGLQKFSAVANTVGLSYEYATAALATVTAQTRESAETVGTAFKTIFARLESLSLGETLDDETTMTKYSQALAKVGVNIKTANGQLKDMDTIIDELGQKWDSIGKDQQIALAQTVAGMRQYNNFIALMDNYDTFTANVDIAVNSEGDLSEQAEIYAESWEAAKDRATAAAEALYDKLLDDKTFIKITDTFTKLLELIDKFVDSAGGLKGILAMLAGILTRMFNQQISRGMEDMVYNFKSFFGLAKKEAKSIKELTSELVDSFVPADGYTSETHKAEIAALKQKIALQTEYAELEGRMTARQKAEVQRDMELFEIAQQNQVSLTQKTEEAENRQAELGLDLKRQAAKKGISFERVTEVRKDDQIDATKQLEKFNAIMAKLAETAGKGDGNLKDFTLEMENLIKETREMSDGQDNPLTQYMQSSLDETKDALGRPNYATTSKYLKWESKYSTKDEKGSSKKLQEQKLIAEAYADSRMAEDLEVSIDKIHKYNDACEETDELRQKLIKSGKKTEELEQNIRNGMEQSTSGVIDYYEAFTDLASVGTSLYSVFTSIGSIWDTLSDPDLTGWEKVTSVFLSLTSILPMVTIAFKTMSELHKKNTISLGLQDIALKINTLLTRENTEAKEDNGEGQKGQKEGIEQKTRKLNKENIQKGFQKVKKAPEALKRGASEFGRGFKQTGNQIIAKGGLGKKAAAKAGAKLAANAGPQMSSLASSLGSIASVAIPIVIAVAAITAAIAGTVAIYKAAEKSAQKAEKQAKATQKAADEAKQAYQETADTIERYGEAAKGLRELTKGTQEWKDALTQTNEEARSLIDRFGKDLKAGDYYFEDGQIKFKEGVLEDLQAKEYANAMQIQAGADATQLIAKQKRLEADKIQHARKNMRNSGGGLSGEQWGAIGAMTAGGAAAGAAIGSLFGGVGAIPGVALGAMIGVGAGLVTGGITAAASGGANKREQDALDKLAEEYRKDSTVWDKLMAGDKATQEALGFSDKMVAALKSNKDATLDLVKEMAANVDESRLLRETMVANSNVGKEAYDKSNNQEYINAFAANAMEDTTSNRYKQVSEEVHALWKGSNTREGGFWDTYLKEIYGDEADQYRITNTWGGNVTLQKKNEDGQWVTDETIGKNGLNEKDAEAALIQARMANLTDEEIAKFDDQADKIQMQLREAGLVGKDLIYSAGLDFVQGNEMDLSKLSYADLTALNIKEIKRINKELGEALETAQKNSDEAWKKAANNYSLFVGKEIEISEKLTAYALNQISGAMKELAIKGGPQAATAFNDYITNLVDQFPHKANEIADVISQIDWEQGGTAALASMSTQLAAIGIHVDTTTNDWRAMAKVIEQIQMSIYAFNLDEFRKDLVSVNKLLDELDFGKVITDEDFNTLRQYSAEVRDLFIKTADGYAYVGEKGQLDNVVAQQLRGDMSAQLDRLAMGVDVQNQFKSGRLDLTETKDSNPWDDMEMVATSNEFADFRKMYNISAKTYQNMAKRARELEAKRRKGELTDTEKDEWDEIVELKEAMYGHAEDLKGRDFEVEKRDVAEVTLSTYKSLEKLREAEHEYANDPVLAEAYADRVKQLEKAYEKLDENFNKLKLDWTKKQIDELEKVTGAAIEQAELLADSFTIYDDQFNTLMSDLDSIAKSYEVATRLEGESVGEYMARIVATAPEAYEEVEKTSQAILTLMNNYRETEQQLSDSLIKYFEDVEKKYDKDLTKYERESKSLSHHKNVLELVNASNENYKLMSQLAEAETKVATVSLGVSRQKYEELKVSRQMAEKNLEEAIRNGDEVSQATWEETLEQLVEMEYAALDEMNENWTSALEAAKEEFQTNVKQILNTFEESMTGVYGTFERMQQIFNQQSELNAQYVADYKKIYELSKLSRNIQKEIDNTDSVFAKKRLRELQAEINELEAEGVLMSQYDLDYRQKEYDLLLAELALEEARNAKNQVRLTKMANGSWGYIYTQNSEEVENAQQNWEDKLYELQDLSANYLQETSQAILQVQADFNAALDEIMSSGLSDEEKRAQIEETVEFYQERLSFLTSEFDNVIANNQGMANMVQNFSDSLLGAMYPAGEITSGDDIFTKWKNSLGTIDGDSGGTGILGEINAEMFEYSEKVKGIFDVAGIQGSIEGYISGIDTSLNGAGENDPGLLDTLQNSINEMAEWSPEDLELAAFEGLLDKIGGYKEDLDTALDELKAVYEEFLGIKNQDDFIPDLKPNDLPKGELPSELEGEEIPTTDSYSHQGGIVQIQGNQMPGQIGTGYFGTGSGRSGSGGGAPVVMVYEPGMAKILALGVGFDTGGYTGVWGPGGKLAMVHEKELILNKEDTPNLLAAVDIVRQIGQRVELQAAAASSTTMLGRAPTIHNEHEPIQQEVTIHAEFPHATNHSEIEQAFDTLINRAAQYTNQYK